MTPDYAQMFGAPPSEEQRRHMEEQARAARAFQEHALQEEVEQRRRVLRWAALLCTCRPWYAPRADAPQAYCGVHGSQLITPDGTLI